MPFNPVLSTLLIVAIFCAFILGLRRLRHWLEDRRLQRRLAHIVMHDPVWQQDHGATRWPSYGGWEEEGR